MTAFQLDALLTLLLLSASLAVSSERAALRLLALAGLGMLMCVLHIGKALGLLAPH